MQKCKECSKCRIVKPVSDFYIHKGSPYSQCKPCKLSADRESRSRRREKIREYEKSRYLRDGDKRRALSREVRRKYIEEVRLRDRVRYRGNASLVIARESAKAKDLNEASKFLQTTVAKRWSPEEDAILLANDGRTLYQKAVDIGRSYHGARYRSSYLRKEMNNA